MLAKKRSAYRLAPFLSIIAPASSAPIHIGTRIVRKWKLIEIAINAGISQIDLVRSSSRRSRSRRNAHNAINTIAPSTGRKLRYGDVRNAQNAVVTMMDIRDAGALPRF